MKIEPKNKDIVSDTNNKRFDNTLYKLNDLKRDGYPSSISSQINDLENIIIESYHSYLLQEVIELNNQGKYEQALSKIKDLQNKSNISYNINNRINEKKKIIIINLAYSKLKNVITLKDNKQYNDCINKISEIRNMENFPSELNGQLTNLEDCVCSEQEKFEESINKFKEAINYEPNEQLYKNNMFSSLSNILISFLNNSNYNNIDKYVSLGLSYNPSNNFQCLFYFIKAIAKKNNKEYKEVINNYNSTITLSKILNDDECEKLFKKNKEDTIDLFYNHLFVVIYEMIKYSNEGNY